MLEKATIQRLKPDGITTIGDPITVLFNPTEYSIDTSNQFQRTALPGTATPITQFVSGNTETLTVDLFFDTYENEEFDTDKNEKKVKISLNTSIENSESNYLARDVRQYTDQIMLLMNIDPGLRAPPVCKFSWGQLSFKGTIEQVTQNFTLFLESGIPVRATLSVTFQEYKTLSEQLKNPGKESSDPTKRITVKQGDSLYSIANQEYEDPSAWRSIAIANKISNPRILAVGQEVVVPRLR